MNWYPHHIGDYAQDTRHLTMIEHGAYRLLMDLYYSRESPLPRDVSTVLRLACARSREEKQAVEAVLREFFIESADGWRHERCDREIEIGRRKQEAARENGKKGGRKPSKPPELTDKEPTGFGLVKPAETGCKTPNPNPNPNPNISDDLSIIVDSGAPKPDEPKPDEPKLKTWADWSRWWRDVRGIEIDPGSVSDRRRFVPLAERWVAAGITPAQMLRALERAEATAAQPIAYLPSYVDRVLASEQAPPNERDARLGQWLGELTGGLAGTPQPKPDFIDVEPIHVGPRRIA